jgi:hypothetical protein
MVSRPFQSFLKRLNDPRERRRRMLRTFRRQGRHANATGRPSNWGCAAETLEDRSLLSAAAPLSPPSLLGSLKVPIPTAPAPTAAAAPGSVAPSSSTIKSNATLATPPTVTAPPSEVVVLNSIYEFPAIAIAISDAAASGNSDSVTLTASHGTLSVEQDLPGLGIAGSGTTSMTLTGILPTLRAALSILVYTPNTGYLGSDSLQISLTNEIDGLTGSATVVMNVAALPEVTVPPSEVVTENSSLNFGNAISLADPSVSSASDSLTFSVTWGTVTLGSTTGLTFTAGSDSSRYITVSGTLANLNSALSGLVYTPSPAFSGYDILYVGALDTADGLATAGTVDLTVEALPAPVVTAPSTASVIENGSTIFPSGSINVTDSEVSGSNAESLSLSVAHGGLTLGSTSGLTFAAGSNGSSSMTVTGTLASLNLALSGLAYSPNSTYIGGDTLHISAEDEWDAQTGSTSIALTVNALPSPIISAPSSQAVGENGLLTFGAGVLSLTDSSASGTSDTLTLSVANGILTLGSTNGLTFNSGSNGSSSITVTGTLANLNAALDGLVYAPNAGDVGFDLLQISVNDSGDALSASAAVLITVGGGTPPVVTAPASVFVGVNSPENFYTLALADAGAWGNSDSLTLTASNGTISLMYTGVVTFTAGSNNSSSMTINGTIKDLDDALSSVEYVPNTNYVGPDRLQLTLTNALDNLTGSASISIDDVYSPTVSAQYVMYELENSPYVIGSSAIKLTDLAATTTSDSLTLFMRNSSITLASTTGLTFTSGANGDAEMTVTGSLANLNAAVNGLAITLPDYEPAELRISLSNSVDGLSGDWPADIFVVANPPAMIAAPSVESIGENSSFTFSNGTISITDPESAGTGAATDSVALSVSDGILALGSTNGLTFTAGSNSSSSMTVTGTLTNVNAALNGLVYTPNNGFVGSDSLDLLANNTTEREPWRAIVTIYVGEQPSVSAPTSQFVLENGSLPFNNSILVSDPFAAGISDSVSLSVANGALELGGTTGITFVSGANDSSSMTISGTLANLNAALNLQYFPNSNYLGADALQLTLTDWGDGLTQSASVPISVVNAPAISAPASASLGENSSFSFAGTITATDAAASGASDSISLSVANGTLTLGSTAGITFSSGSNGSSSMTINGTLANLNTALAALAYAPKLDYTGSDSLQISAIDSGDSFSGSASVAITVQAPPVISAPATAGLNENTSYTFSGSSITLADSTASGTSDSLSISVVDGKLTLGSTTGLTFSAGANRASSMTVTGTLANLNAALNGLVYAPNAGYSGPDSLQISVNDTGDNLAGSAAVSITVNAPPSIAAPATATLNENAPWTFSGTISVTDAAASGNGDSLALSVAHGTLTLSTIGGLTFTAGANGTASFTVTGSVANLNAALNSLTYRPTANYAGSDSLAISISDPGDNQSASTSVALTVIALPQPSISAPTNASLNPNGSLVFSSANGNAITVADSGPGSNTDSLTLTVTHGTVTLSTTSGLTVTAGLNGSSSITVVGPVANLNAALSALTYKPITGYSGSDSLAIALKDSVDSLSASANVALTVSNPPAITAPATAAVMVTSTLTFSTANKNAVSIADVSAGSAVEPLTLTATDGTLSLGSTSGIAFSSGTNNSASMTINGTLANLNAALSGLTFKPATVGTATVVLSYTDIGDGLLASATITITVSKGATKLVVGAPVSPPSSPAVARGASVNSPAAGGTVTPAATLTTSNGTTDDSAMPPDALTQWQGLSAAVDVLIG